MFLRSSFRKGAAGALTLAALVGGATIALAQEAKPATPPKKEMPAIVVGKPAPEFELRDTDGKAHSLKQHHGKIVVLEWFNPACAEVRNQHLEGSMSVLAREFETESKIVWLGVNSLAAGEKGAGKDATIAGRKELNVKFPVLLDDNGAIARKYAVLQTPTVFVIDAEGIVRYFGAIDNAPKVKTAKDVKLTVYLEDAINAVLYGSELATPKTEATGCPLKLQP